jgi:membrane-associated protease RseP (regulator of RpoE activity)
VIGGIGLGGILSGLVSVIAVAGAFLILIGPHEAGHFVVAKLF